MFSCLNLSNSILATLTPFHFQRIPNPFRICLHPDVESHIIEINWIKKIMLIFCTPIFFFRRYTFGKPVDGTTLVKFSMVGKRIKAVSVKQSSPEVISFLMLWSTYSSLIVKIVKRLQRLVQHFVKWLGGNNVII